MYQIVFKNTAGNEMMDRIVFQSKKDALDYAEANGWFYSDPDGKLWEMKLEVLS